MYPSYQYFPVGYPVYQPPQPQPSPQPTPVPDTGLTYVNGMDEVTAWVVCLGDSAYLFDRNQNVFYVKSVSDNGMPNPIEVYDYTLRETSDNKTEPVNMDDYVKREELEALKDQIKSMKKREVMFDE